MKGIKVFTLSKSQQLGDKITIELGIKLSKLETQIFSDGERSVWFDESIRDQKVYIVGSTYNSDSIIETVLAVDAAKRAGAKKVNLIMPYFCYSRQDRKDKHRGAIGASAIAHMFESSGVDSFMFIDLHANAIEGFFHKPVVHIQGNTIFIPFLRDIINDEDWVVCSPDKGGVERASHFSDAFKTPLMFINKKRDRPNSIASMELIGDVSGKKVLIVDDIIDTGNSLVKATELLLSKGAIEVRACITHPVLSGKSYEIIGNSKLTKLYVSDTIPVENLKNGIKLPKNIQVISSAPMISKVLRAISDKNSISQLQKRVTE